MSAVLEGIVQKLKVKLPFEWVRDEATVEDLQHIQREGTTPSQFDPLELRKQMLDDLASGKAVLRTKRGPFAKVLAIVSPESKIPWKTLGQIFSAFGPPKGKKSVWRVVWFAHSKKREFPDFTETENVTRHFTETENVTRHFTETHGLADSVKPQHINGGYAYACAPETIIIYREEEVERVLVHELLHAACTDDMSKPDWMREVLTETWAELFLTGILAQGSLPKAKKLWKIQAQWIADQEAVLMGEYKITSPEHFPWRYTVGRRSVLEGLGILLPNYSANPKFMLGTSLRFTSPVLLV
jgi:hypothetical protein